MATRTPQGTIAWIVSLNTMPVLAVPAYWVFGRDRFHGYVIQRRKIESSDDAVIQKLITQLKPFRMVEPGAMVGEQLAELPSLRGNEVELLVDGQATFDSILAGVRQAKHTLLVQFYIVRDDGLGRELQAALIERARAGVQVFFLYDEMGSLGLPRHYVDALREAGVRASAFHSTRGSGNRFQLNFRNHRKIVVADAQEAWVGGHNVGDEYLGKDAKIGHWRDTHMRLKGPSVVGLMTSFAEDWRWATGDSVPVELWESPFEKKGEAAVLVLPSGPADRLETASLMYQQAIASAKHRVWIASPYFVPDPAVMQTLHLAALRGVDVRIVIPEQPDSRLVYYSAFAFAEPLLESGVRIFRYGDGFLHEKVILVDDGLAGVGTANFDNRSFRLNFEVTAIVSDRAFANAVAHMLESDFAASQEMQRFRLQEKDWSFQLAVRASMLLAPLQ